MHTGIWNQTKVMEMRAKENIVPCVVFAFNRPDKLERVLSALRTQDIDRLIVFVDGPRDGADVELVERCRTIAKGADWVDKELYFGEQNRGLPGLSDNVGMVMNVYKSAVFVEDDCLPMPGFYSFMQKALNHYEPEKKVFSIGGYQPIQQKYFKNYPYSLVSYARFLCWGWATWRDRWELITPYLSRYWELFDGLRNVPNIAGNDLADMAQGCANGKIKSWAVQVAISSLWLKKVHLLPTKGLIRNTGFDDTGIHKRTYSYVYNRNVSNELFQRINWLDDVEIRPFYTEELKNYIIKANSQRLWIQRFLSRGKAALRKIPFIMNIWRILRSIKRLISV